MKAAIRLITSPRGNSCTDFTPKRHSRWHRKCRSKSPGETPSPDWTGEAPVAPSNNTSRVVTVLVNRLRLPRHVIHQQILPERVGRRKVGLATAHLGYLLDELHQAIVRRQHERIDQHARAFAL